MDKKELIDLLLRAIEHSDEDKSDFVGIPRGDAADIVSLLLGIREVKQPKEGKDGQVLFYCSDCGQSFWADPREDTECFTRWHYHRWFANCPACGDEVTQNDRYWR